jgi:hypothetical protein
MPNVTTIISPRDISKSQIATGIVPTTAGGTLFVGENAQRVGLLIRNNDAANSLVITLATLGAGAPITAPVAAGVGQFTLTLGQSIFFGQLQTVGINFLFGGPAATCGFFGLAITAGINITAWEWIS